MILKQLFSPLGRWRTLFNLPVLLFLPLCSPRTALGDISANAAWPGSTPAVPRTRPLGATKSVAHSTVLKSSHRVIGGAAAALHGNSRATVANSRRVRFAAGDDSSASRSNASSSKRGGGLAVRSFGNDVTNTPHHPRGSGGGTVGQRTTSTRVQSSTVRSAVERSQSQQMAQPRTDSGSTTTGSAAKAFYSKNSQQKRRESSIGTDTDLSPELFGSYEHCQDRQGFDLGDPDLEQYISQQLKAADNDKDLPPLPDLELAPHRARFISSANDGKSQALPGQGIFDNGSLASDEDDKAAALEFSDDVRQEHSTEKPSDDDDAFLAHLLQDDENTYAASCFGLKLKGEDGARTGHDSPDDEEQLYL